MSLIVKKRWNNKKKNHFEILMIYFFECSKMEVDVPKKKKVFELFMIFLLIFLLFSKSRKFNLIFIK